MTPAVFGIIAASAECTAIIGSPPQMRFYSFSEAPQTPQRPYAVWQMITSVPANYLGRLPDTDDARVQVDVYADQQSTANQLAVAIRDAIEPHAHMVNASDRARDPTTRAYGYLMEFEFFTPRDT
jgi:uncharacterized protein DUF3168